MLQSLKFWSGACESVCLLGAQVPPQVLLEGGPALGVRLQRL